MSDPASGEGPTRISSRAIRRTVWILLAVVVAAAGAAVLLVWSRSEGGASAPIATESGPAVEEAYRRCGARSGGEKLECYQEALTERLEEAGIAAAMSTLEGLYERDRDVERDAHVYAHHIGIQAYARTPSVAETFSQCSDMYSSGCYHGVLQAYFEDRGTVDSVAVNDLCTPYKGGGQSRWILFQCLHGMGHGLTMYYDHRLFPALEACDFLVDGWDRQSCYGGAFMENIMHATAPHHPATVLAEQTRHEAGAAGQGEHVHGVEEGADSGTATVAGASEPFRALDPEDPLYPCSALEDRYLPACYLMQTSAILYLNGGDIPDAAKTCERAPAAMRSICFQSLGRDITSFSLQDPDRSFRDCRAVPESYRPDCVQGVVKALVDWRSAPEPGFEFCRRVKGVANKERCYRALGEEIATLIADAGAREALCEGAENEYVENCRLGARLPSRRPASGS